MNDQVDWEIISEMFDHSHLPPYPPPRKRGLIYWVVCGIILASAAVWYLSI